MQLWAREQWLLSEADANILGRRVQDFVSWIQGNTSWAEFQAVLSNDSFTQILTLQQYGDMLKEKLDVMREAGKPKIDWIKHFSVVQ